jgi:hypothetical protein
MAMVIGGSMQAAGCRKRKEIQYENWKIKNTELNSVRLP